VAGKIPSAVILYGAKKLSSRRRSPGERPRGSSSRTPLAERLLEPHAAAAASIAETLKEEHRRMLEIVRGGTRLAAGKCSFVATTCATSTPETVLERRKIRCSTPKAAAGLAVLDSSPGIDIVLMDVMMRKWTARTTRTIRHRKISESSDHRA